MRIDPPPCQACAYVSTQLGPDTPCFVHVGRKRRTVPDDAYDFTAAPPTSDRPGLFTMREYARLLVLRGRVRERRSLRRAV
jgi:hypothetical protein